jgi:hypothetical protein
MGVMGFVMAYFIEAISPQQHTRSIDRTVMRLQKRIFFGTMPFGKYRAPWKSAYAWLMALFFRLFTVLLLGLWAAKIVSIWLKQNSG